MAGVFANPKVLIRVVGSGMALYDIYAIWSLGHVNPLIGAGIVAALAALAFIWLAPQLSVRLAGVALAGGILAVLLGLAPALVGPLVVIVNVPLIVVAAVEDHETLDSGRMGR